MVPETTRRVSEHPSQEIYERILEAIASAISLVGLLLAILVSWIWLCLPIFVAIFLLLHALQGWCPPVHLLRRFGVRPQSEIEMEKYSFAGRLRRSGGDG